MYKNLIDIRTSLILILALVVLSSGFESVFSQPPGMPGMPMPYYQRPGDTGQPREEEQIRILIKQGTKIFCAWSNQLIHNDVVFKEVTPEEASQFYDDGTHNDEVPFDGLPSNVLINNYQYLSPYAIYVKERMQDLRERLMTTQEINNIPILEWEEQSKWGPLRFYSGFYVASLDDRSPLSKYSNKARDLEDFGIEFEERAIAPFRGYTYYPDKEHRSWERRLWMNWAPEDPAVRREWNLRKGQTIPRPGAQMRGGMMGGMMGMPGMMGGAVGRARGAAEEYDDYGDDYYEDEYY